MTAVLLYLAFASSPQIPEPPMKREWTYVTGENTAVLGVRDATVFFSSQQSVGALDLGTAKPIWTVAEPWIMSGALGKVEIYTLVREASGTDLRAYDLAAGKARTLRHFAEEVSDLATNGSRVFVLLPGKVAAFNLSGTVLWETPAGKAQRGILLANLAASHGVVIAGFEDGTRCFDATSGKLLWEKKAQYGGYNAPTFLDGGVLLQQDGIGVYELRSGKQKWHDPQAMVESYGISNGVLIAEVEDRFIGRDLSSGDVLWTRPGGEEGFRAGSANPPSIGDATGVWIASDKVHKFDSKGEELWTRKLFFSGAPVYAGDDWMVTNDWLRILCYRKGEQPALPEGEDGRRALAEQYVRAYELLDRVEIERLVALGNYAAQPLVRRYVGWAKEYSADKEDKRGRGQFLYGLLTDTDNVLDKICGPADTEALLAAIAEIGPKNSYASALEGIVGRRGDPAKAIPIFVKRLRVEPRSSEESGGSALSAVAASNHPDAVQFMIEALKNPKSPKSWRSAAFQHLAGTGAMDGVEAVRKARAVRKPAKRWQDRIVFGKSRRSREYRERKDAQGRTWRLFSHSVLGNYSDLFMAEKKGAKWGEPIFIGTYTGRTWSQKAPTSYRGIAMARFLSTEWIKLLPNDRAIRKDSDKDGLTDLVEARLGTNAAKADTDGDGYIDSVDPCPNAAPKTLSDREKIIAAATEARFFGEHWRTPAIVEIDGVRPFELYGYPGTVIWKTKDYKGDLPQMYNTGVNMIAFHAVPKDMRENVNGKDWVEFGPDGKTAKTVISRYSGGLNGDGTEVHLIKVDDDWFVVDMIGRYVS